MDKLIAKILGTIEIDKGVPLSQIKIQEVSLGSDVAGEYVVDVVVFTGGNTSVLAKTKQVKMSFSDFNNNLKKIRGWIEFVKLQMNLNSPLKELIKSNIDITDTGLSFVYEFNNKRLSDGSWDKLKDEFTFKTNQKIDINFGSYILLVGFLESVLATVERIKLTN